LRNVIRPTAQSPKYFTPTRHKSSVGEIQIYRSGKLLVLHADGQRQIRGPRLGSQHTFVVHRFRRWASCRVGPARPKLSPKLSPCRTPGGPPAIVGPTIPLREGWPGHMEGSRTRKFSHASDVTFRDRNCICHRRRPRSLVRHLSLA